MNDSLKERTVVFLDDLKKFNESVLFRAYTDSSLMSGTYFTTHEIEVLKSQEIQGNTLEKALQDLFERKIENTLCSSHDLFPLYFKYLRLSKKDFSKKFLKKSRQKWLKWSESNDFK